MRRVQSPWKPWKDAITKLKGILARNVTNEKQWGKSLPADLVFICVVENPSWGVSKNFQQPELRLRIGPYIVVWSRDSTPSGSEWSYQREYDQWREASYPWLQERDSSWSTKLKLPCSKATALLGSAALHLTARWPRKCGRQSLKLPPYALPPSIHVLGCNSLPLSVAVSSDLLLQVW